jgi:tetratricopeptide (TPR) repeat protein
MKTYLLPLFLLFAISIYAQEKTFVKEYTYKASDADSKVSCEAIAINQLRTELLNELGVYVESNQILNSNDIAGKFSQDFKENISTISAGITKVNVLDEKWNGETFWMKASISVDTASLKESLKRISEDHQKVKELTDLKQQLNDANQKLADLTKQLSEQKQSNANATLIQNYNAKVNDIISGNAMFDAKAKLNSQDYAGAIEDLGKVIAVKPKNSLAYAYRGHARVHLKDYVHAIEDFDSAIALNHNFDAAYVDRGHAKLFLNQYREAVADFSYAIALSPNYSYAYTSRGEAKLKLKEFQSAVEDFTKAIQCDANYAMAYLNRGIAKNWLGQKGCNDWNKAAQLECAEAFDLLKKYCK